MAVNFPTSPSLNQEYSYGEKTWKFDGSGWRLNPSVINQNDSMFMINKNTVVSNSVIPNGYNAISVGPVTVPLGTTIEVSPGSTWVIV